MRSCIANFAILLVLYSSLVQSKLLQTIGTPFRVASAIGGGLRKLILPDVSLPTDKSLYEAKDLLTNIVDLSGLSTYDAVKFAMKGGFSASLNLNGKSKSDLSAADDLHKQYVDENINHRELLPKGYRFFGSNSNVENLELFLKHNPFAASALTKVDDQIAVVSMGDSAGPKSWFKRSVDLLDDSYPRVVATFSDDMKLQDITAYDSFTRQVLPISKEEAAGDLLFLLSFYFELVHATLHVLHYIMASALKSAAKLYPMLSSWVEPYVANIGVQYMEVEVLLLRDGGLLGGGSFRTRTGDGREVRRLARELLCMYGSCSSADDFIAQLFSIPITSSSSSSSSYYSKGAVLQEFSKHVALVGDYAEQLTSAFEGYDPRRYADMNARLTSFLTQCGPGVSKVSNLRTWLEIMSVTGILHGSSLSLTRLLCTTEMLKRCNLKSEVYGLQEVATMQLGVMAMVGVVEGKHVFSANTVQNYLRRAIVGVPPFDPIAANVLQEFDAKAAKLKKDYYEQLMKDEDLFSEHGWILSDFCPDGIDGKQLTITTYI